MESPLLVIRSRIVLAAYDVKEHGLCVVMERRHVETREKERKRDRTHAPAAPENFSVPLDMPRGGCTCCQSLQ